MLQALHADSLGVARSEEGLLPAGWRVHRKECVGEAKEFLGGATESSEVIDRADRCKGIVTFGDRGGDGVSLCPVKPVHSLRLQHNNTFYATATPSGADYALSHAAILSIHQYHPLTSTNHQIKTCLLQLHDT
jgi:hypothetical protein